MTVQRVKSQFVINKQKTKRGKVVNKLHLSLHKLISSYKLAWIAIINDHPHGTTMPFKLVKLTIIMFYIITNLKIKNLVVILNINNFL